MLSLHPGTVHRSQYPFLLGVPGSASRRAARRLAGQDVHPSRALELPDALLEPVVVDHLPCTSRSSSRSRPPSSGASRVRSRK